MKQCDYKRRGKSSAFCMLNYWPLTIRSRLIVKYSADNSMPTYLRPDSWQATPVEPPPMNGSSTVPPGCVMASRSRMSATGLLVRWTFWAATTGYEYRPGKQDREGAAKRPLEPEITNSHCCLNLPTCGRADLLSHGTIPSQRHPAPCIASVNAGNCLQSVKTMRGAPSLAMRQHSPSQSILHIIQLLWSLASPNMGG